MLAVKNTDVWKALSDILWPIHRELVDPDVKKARPVDPLRFSVWPDGNRL